MGMDERKEPRISMNVLAKAMRTNWTRPGDVDVISLFSWQSRVKMQVVICWSSLSLIVGRVAEMLASSGCSCSCGRSANVHLLLSCLLNNACVSSTPRIWVVGGPCTDEGGVHPA